MLLTLPLAKVTCYYRLRNDSEILSRKEKQGLMCFCLFVFDNLDRTAFGSLFNTRLEIIEINSFVYT